VKPGFDEVAGKDGLVSIPEIAAAVRKHGVPNFQKLFKNHPDNQKEVQVTDEADKTVFDALLEEAQSDDGITSDELITMTKHFAKAHGVKLPPGWEEEAKKVHAAADANGDGSVGPVELVESIFAAFDHSEPKEKLTLKEVRQAIQWLSKQLGKPLKKGWKKMVAVGFKAADANGDGVVSMGEFKDAVAEHGLPIEELFK
jgi:Ca2+-binding EF-hand superfamily protein